MPDLQPVASVPQRGPTCRGCRRSCWHRRRVPDCRRRRCERSWGRCRPEWPDYCPSSAGPWRRGSNPTPMGPEGQSAPGCSTIQIRWGPWDPSLLRLAGRSWDLCLEVRKRWGVSGRVQGYGTGQCLACQGQDGGPCYRVVMATRNNVLGSSAAQYSSWKRTIKHSFESERQTDRQGERISNITHRSKQRN